MAFSENQGAIAELYIAALGRSPEKSGLDYWVGELEAGRKTLVEIQDNFFDTNIPEVAARFPVGTTSTQFVESVYVNVFGRASDEGGLNYWSNRLDLPASDENHLSTSTLMSTMLQIAKDPANSIDGAVLADNLSDAELAYDENNITVSENSNLYNDVYDLDNHSLNLIYKYNYDGAELKSLHLDIKDVRNVNGNDTATVFMDNGAFFTINDDTNNIIGSTVSGDETYDWEFLLMGKENSYTSYYTLIAGSIDDENRFTGIFEKSLSLENALLNIYDNYDGIIVGEVDLIL